MGSAASSFANSGSSGTDNVDWYLDNSNTYQTCGKLQVSLPRVFSGLKATTANQCAIIAGDRGRLQSFYNLVARTGVIPASGQLDLLINQLQGQIEYQAFAWIIPSKYQIFLQDQWSTQHDNDNCMSTGSMTSTGHYLMRRGEQATYYGCKDGSICTTANHGCSVKSTTECGQQRLAWLGEIASGHYFYVPQDSLFDAINQGCGSYMETAFGTSDFLEAAVGTAMWRANYNNPTVAANDNGISLQVHLQRTCHTQGGSGRCGANPNGYNCQPVTNLPPWAQSS